MMLLQTLPTLQSKLAMTLDSGVHGGFNSLMIIGAMAALMGLVPAGLLASPAHGTVACVCVSLITVLLWIWVLPTVHYSNLQLHAHARVLYDQRQKARGLAPPEVRVAIEGE